MHRAAATGKERSPIVLRRVAGTMTSGDELERSLRLVSTSATRLMLSARYTGAGLLNSLRVEIVDQLPSYTKRSSSFDEIRNWPKVGRHIICNSIFV